MNVVTISPLVKKIIDTNPFCTEIFESKGKFYTFLNPVSYLEALKNKDLYSNFDGIFVDGKFLAIAIKILYQKKITRFSFDTTSIAPELFSYAEKNNKTLYIIAGKQEEIDKTVAIFCKHFPQLNIIGSRNGYFNSEEEINSEIQKIIKINPDFIVCGMGAVKQEQFLMKLKDANYNGIAFTCGGFISQTSKCSFTYYPHLFDILDLRFVYRMIKEKHTRKRYLQAFFWFPIKFVWEWVKGIAFPKNAETNSENQTTSQNSLQI